MWHATIITIQRTNHVYKLLNVMKCIHFRNFDMLIIFAIAMFVKRRRNLTRAVWYIDLPIGTMHHSYYYHCHSVEKRRRRRLLQQCHEMSSSCEEQSDELMW